MVDFNLVLSQSYRACPEVAKGVSFPVGGGEIGQNRRFCKIDLA